jgi:hypothetical protein
LNLFTRESVLLKLKQALKFLYAVNTTETAYSTSELALDKSFPKLMTSKIWHEHVSLCQYFESSHPYREKKYRKKVSFPGASQLFVNFDNRIALVPGDKLTLSTPSHTVVLTAPIAETILKKPAEFAGDELTIVLESANQNLSSAEEWGWAFLVSATGPVYESAEAKIDLEKDINLSNLEVTEGEIERIVQEMKEEKQVLNVGLKGEAEALTHSSLRGVTFTSLGDWEEEKAELSADCGEPETLSHVEDSKSGIDVGIDSSELYKNESEIELAERPQSKMGKRETGKFKDSSAKEKESSESKEGKKDGEAKAEEEEADKRIEILNKYGKLLKKDSIGVPHASKISVAINRLTDAGSDQTQQFLYLFNAMRNEGNCYRLLSVSQLVEILILTFLLLA